MFLPLLTMAILPTLPGMVPVSAWYLGVIINGILFTVRMISYLITAPIRHYKEMAGKSIQQL